MRFVRIFVIQNSQLVAISVVLLDLVKLLQKKIKLRKEYVKSVLSYKTAPIEKWDLSSTVLIRKLIRELGGKHIKNLEYHIIKKLEKYPYTFNKYINIPRKNSHDRLKVAIGESKIKKCLICNSIVYSNLAVSCNKKCSNKLPEKIQSYNSTMLERYGNTCYLQSDVGKKKRLKAIKKRFGTYNFSASEKVLSKKRNTWLKNYGAEHPMQNRDYYEKHSKNLYVWKTYSLGNKLVKVQGYEPKALDYLLYQKRTPYRNISVHPKKASYTNKII